MKKVLFIAYYFPPSGGAGVQRSVKFVKFLPELGWLPIVLTTADGLPCHWSPRDESLPAEIPAAVPIYRTDPFSLPPEMRWKQRLRELAGLSSPFGKSWESAILKTGTRACEEHRPDLIFISMSPFEGAAAAATLARQMNLPWVADLRDPWALDEMQVHLSGLHRKIEQRRMGRLLREATAIVMNTPESAKRLRLKLPELRDKRIRCIPNGFDAEDFAGLARNPNPAQFTIVHTGFLHTALGLELRRKRLVNGLLGRVMCDVDFLTRSHYFLLEALERWVKSDPNLRSQIRLILAGNLTEEDKKIVRDSSIESLVSFTGYLPHNETVKLLANADLLFLPMHNVSRGHRASIVPGKTYEYMATGRPILAAVPEGDARDFVAQAGTGLICPPDDVAGIIRILHARYEAWRNQSETLSWNKGFVEQFERRKLTKQLATVFDSLLVKSKLQNNYEQRPGEIYQPADSNHERVNRGHNL